MSLATDYRPTNFESVVGQQTTVRILKQQLASDNLVGCYLFNGPSGCGKTTIARIFSNEMNDYKGHPIEIDAASNNSVDNVRLINQNAKQRSLDSKYKIYIIDECHALSNASWQALLKLIEEPIPFTKFIFCTTNPEKIPTTILTRVQQFNFTKVTSEDIKNRLKYIIGCERDKLFGENSEAESLGAPDYEYSEEALDYIVSLSNNGVRQAIANLEKCLAYSTELCMDNVTAALGSGNYEDMSQFITAVISSDTSTSISILENLYQDGIDPKQFIYNCLIFILDLNKSRLSSVNNTLPDIEPVINLLQYNSKFLWLLSNFSKLYEEIRYENNPLPVIEISVFNWSCQA